MTNTTARLRRIEMDAAHRFHIRGTAIMTFVIYWLMVLTYQDFFLFDPSESSGVFRQFTLWLCLAGWLVAAAGTPILLLLAAQGSLRALSFVPLTVLWWPISVVLAQISAYADSDEGYLDYLFDYPIFVLTDLALPVFLLVKWSRMREVVAKAKIAMS